MAAAQGGSGGDGVAVALLRTAERGAAAYWVGVIKQAAERIVGKSMNITTWAGEGLQQPISRVTHGVRFVGGIGCAQQPAIGADVEHRALAAGGYNGGGYRTRALDRGDVATGIGDRSEVAVAAVTELVDQGTSQSIVGFEVATITAEEVKLAAVFGREQ